MDALEFLRERKRMCKSYKDCEDCPLEGDKCIISDIMSDEDCKRIIATVEQWSKENPRKTRQSVFLEQWPEADLDEDGHPVLDPCGFCKKMRGECIGKTCPDCRREFWMQEVE